MASVRAIVTGALDELKSVLGDAITLGMLLCDRTMKLIAAVLESSVIIKILDHVGLPTLRHHIHLQKSFELIELT